MKRFYESVENVLLQVNIIETNILSDINKINLQKMIKDYDGTCRTVYLSNQFNENIKTPT